MSLLSLFRVPSATYGLKSARLACPASLRCLARPSLVLGHVPYGRATIVSRWLSSNLPPNIPRYGLPPRAPIVPPVMPPPDNNGPNQHQNGQDQQQQQDHIWREIRRVTDAERRKARRRLSLFLLVFVITMGGLFLYDQLAGLPMIFAEATQDALLDLLEDPETFKTLGFGPDTIVHFGADQDLQAENVSADLLRALTDPAVNEIKVNIDASNGIAEFSGVVAVHFHVDPSKFPSDAFPTPSSLPVRPTSPSPSIDSVPDSQSPSTAAPTNASLQATVKDIKNAPKDSGFESSPLFDKDAHPVASDKAATRALFANAASDSNQLNETSEADADAINSMLQGPIAPTGLGSDSPAADSPSSSPIAPSPKPGRPQGLSSVGELIDSLTGKKDDIIKEPVPGAETVYAFVGFKAVCKIKSGEEPTIEFQKVELSLYNKEEKKQMPPVVLVAPEVPQPPTDAGKSS